MNDQEIQSFLKSEFKVECFRIEIKREGAEPLNVSGPGVIEQDEDFILNFRIHADDEEVKAVLNVINKPREVGKIIPKEDYFKVTAYSYNIPVWNAEVAGIGCDRSFVDGGIIHGQLPEIFSVSDLPSECTKDYAKLYARETVKFPETGFTETEVKRGGKTRRQSSNRDYANFKVEKEDFELLKYGDGISLSCAFSKGGISEFKHIRIQEALQFALGQRFQPCILELMSDETEVTVLKSTAFRADSRGRQNPPLSFNGKLGRSEVFEIAKAFYAKICDHKEEKWHPVSSQVYYLHEAGTAAVELQCLALGVATEGIADTCHSSLAQVSDEFKKEVDGALTSIAALSLSEGLQNRINGAVRSMKNARGSDRIRNFVDNNNVDRVVFKSWQRLRNASAHGGMMDSNDIEKTLNDLNNVLYLCYSMLLKFTGYAGPRTNYSLPDFPDETPIIAASKSNADDTTS